MDTQIEQMITELSKIDSATENIFVQTEKEKEQYAADLKKKTEKFNKELEDDIQNQLSLYESELIKENNIFIEKLQKDTESSIKKMELSYNKHHTEWAKSIVNTLLKQEEIS